MQHKSLCGTKFHTSSGLCELCLTQHIWLPHGAAVSAVCSACLEGIPLETTVGMQEKHMGQRPFLQCLARVLIPDILHHARGLQCFHSWHFSSLQLHGSSLQPKMPELCDWNAKCLSLPAGLMRAVRTCWCLVGLLGKAKQDVKASGVGWCIPCAHSEHLEFTGSVKHIYGRAERPSIEQAVHSCAFCNK